LRRIEPIDHDQPVAELGRAPTRRRRRGRIARPAAVIRPTRTNELVGVEDETRIVFFHGMRKPHELDRIEFIREHWRADVGALA